MKKFTKAIVAILVLILACSSFTTAFAESELDQEEILELIMSGDDYLVGDGVPFDGTTNPDVSLFWTGGGTNHTHQYITSYAFNVLYNDYPSVYNWYIDWGAITYVLEGSDLPDEDETDNLFAGHFYDPDTGLNYKGTTDTAKSRFLAHFNNAVAAYQAGNYALAFEKLGRAIHYLEDLNAPHHVANLVAGLSNHTSFEQEIDANRTRYTATTASGKYATAIANIPDICARNAKNNLENATSAEALPYNGPWLIAGDYTVPFAMQYVAVILYQFQQAVS